MSRWASTTLGEVVDVLDARRRPVNSEERATRLGDVPYYGANGQQGWIDRPIFNEPLILLAEDGGNFDDFETRPIAYRIDGPSWVNNHAHIIRAKRGTDQRFLFWSLVNRDIRRFISGGTRTKLTQAEMRSIELELPPLPEQRQIVAVLETLDVKISLSERILAKLRLIKAGLLDELIDALPRQKTPNAHLGDLATLITSGSRGWARYYAEDGAKFIRIGNLTREHINLRLTSLVFVHPPSGGEGDRTALRVNDLLISITADLGIIAIVPSGFGDAYINQHIALVRIDPKRANSRWIGHYLRSPNGQRQFTRLNDQGAKAGLNLPTIGRLQIPLPPRSQQDQAVKILDSVDRRIAATLRERDKLVLVRRGLKSDLLTARVRVPLEVTS